MVGEQPPGFAFVKSLWWSDGNVGDDGWDEPPQELRHLYDIPGGSDVLFAPYADTATDTGSPESAAAPTTVRCA
jgi:hypothetical protein